PGSAAALSAGAPVAVAASAAAAAKDSPPAAAANRGAASKDPGSAGSGHRAAEAPPLASGKKSAPIITASLSAGTASAAGKDGSKDDGKGGKGAGKDDGKKDDGKKDDGKKDGNKKDGGKDDGKGGKDDGKGSADTVAALTPARPPEGPGTVPGSSPEPPSSLPRPPVAPASPYPTYADPRRPRVAVHLVGEPLGRVPPGFYGLGAVGQQTLMSYLQQRWRVPAVGSRLVGLTGGLAALDHSLRVGARHTLMARLDSLVLSASPTAGGGPGSPGGPVGGGNPGLAGPAGIGGTLSGRLHVVLLLDGKLLLDRSITMPPTLVLSSETPAQAYSRILFAALDQVAGELYARLVQPPPG
ncbi:MAG TPA: hypothetical protein PLW65_27140, partial [Pseudomonadota bacterium]|nr:hypothetical protein [Pseudomonadota bacterium]